MSTKQRLVTFLYNDHLRTEMVLEEVFSPSLCSSDQSWSKDSGWGEFAQLGFLKFRNHDVKHKRKTCFWTSPDVGNTKRCDGEVGESWPGILWSGRNPRSGRLRPPPRYCSMALDHASLLQIENGKILIKNIPVLEFDIFRKFDVADNVFVYYLQLAIALCGSYVELYSPWKHHSSIVKNGYLHDLSE